MGRKNKKKTGANSSEPVFPTTAPVSAPVKSKENELKDKSPVKSKETGAKPKQKTSANSLQTESSDTFGDYNTPVENGSPSTKVKVEPKLRRKDYETKAVLKNVSEDLKNSDKKLTLFDLILAVTKAASERKKNSHNPRSNSEVVLSGKDLGTLKKEQKVLRDRIEKMSKHEERMAQKEENKTEKPNRKTPPKTLSPDNIPKQLPKSPSSDSLANINESLLLLTNRTKNLVESARDDKEVIENCIKCNKESTTKCTGCRKVFYCSKNCQKEHWSSHKEVCRPYKVGKYEGFGKVLIATRSIGIDEEILKEKPLMVTPKNPDGSCLSCYRRITTSFRCGRCRWPMCSEACSQSPTHAVECGVFGMVGVLGPEGLRDRGCQAESYDIVASLRCLEVQLTHPEKWGGAVQKMGLKHSLNPSNKYQLQEMLMALVTVLRIKNHPKFQHLSESAIYTTLCAVKNFSVLMRSAYEEVSGVCQMASHLGHSCVPNTKMTYHNEYVMVTATEPIEAGAPLTAMFSDILWGTKARRDHLQQTKSFSCACRRCKDPTELGSHFSSLACPQCRGPVTASDPLGEDAPWRCRGCNVQLGIDEVMDINLKLGAEVNEALQKPNIGVLESLLQHWNSKVHEHHYHLHAVKHTLLQLYGRSFENESKVKPESYWVELASKEKLCQKFLKVCSILDPSMAHSVPQFGLGFYELHKTVLEFAKRSYGLALLNEEQLKTKCFLAKALLKRSMEILRDAAEDSSEGILYSRCEEDFVEIGKWMMTVGIIG